MEKNWGDTPSATLNVPINASTSSTISYQFTEIL